MSTAYNFASNVIKSSDVVIKVHFQLMVGRSPIIINCAKISKYEQLSKSDGAGQAPSFYVHELWQ